VYSEFLQLFLCKPIWWDESIYRCGDIFPPRTYPHGFNLYKEALLTSQFRPTREHTEIEEELHDKANIDYDRVAIVANPSVAALYEDALVYETGTAITSSGALTAYSGAKTGRSPLDKRIVREPSSEKEIWWGPVNKPMEPEVRNHPVLWGN
jgi:phosphoenolpyruvate carboxykinase (ATP)